MDSCFAFIPFSPSPSSKGSSNTVLWVLKLIQFFNTHHTPHSSPPLSPSPQTGVSQAWNTSLQALRPCLLVSSAFKSLSKFCLLREALPSHLKITPLSFPPSTPVSLYFFHRLYHNLKLSWSLIY